MKKFLYLLIITALFFNIFAFDTVGASAKAAESSNDKIGLSLYHFSQFADNYNFDNKTDVENRLMEIEDVLAEGYVNTLFLTDNAALEGTIELCKKYNCEFWLTSPIFLSKEQSIEAYIKSFETTIEKIKNCGGWDIFSGFHWDEPLWRGMTIEELYTMTYKLYEKWGKRNYPVFCIHAFTNSASGGKISMLSPEYTVFITDAGWDLYSYDVRESELNNPTQNATIESGNKLYGTNIKTAQEKYRWYHKEFMKNFNHDVKVWFYPCAYESSTHSGKKADESYCVAHLKFFTELLKEQKNPGGLSIYTYATFTKSGLEEVLPIKHVATGKQILYPNTPKWDTFSKTLKQTKLEFEAVTNEPATPSIPSSNPSSTSSQETVSLVESTVETGQAAEINKTPTQNPDNTDNTGNGIIYIVLSATVLIVVAGAFIIVKLKKKK